MRCQWESIKLTTIGQYNMAFLNLKGPDENILKKKYIFFTNGLLGPAIMIQGMKVLIHFSQQKQQDTCDTALHGSFLDIITPVSLQKVLQKIRMFRTLHHYKQKFSWIIYVITSRSDQLYSHIHVLASYIYDTVTLSYGNP